MWIEFQGEGTFSREWLEQNPQQAQALLARCKGRYPLCKCREPGLPLYIAQRQRLYLARLPNTGPRHAPHCPSYEPEASLCGFRVYSKQAMRESADGHIAIKLDIPLLVGARGPTQPVSEVASASERASRDALGLTGLLHLLWERSEFNRWRPGMRDRRHYRQWRKYLLETAQGIQLRRASLTRHLYVPEPYVPAHALEIEARRQREFARLSQSDGGRPMRMLVLGKVRGVFESAAGPNVRLSHLPNEFAIALTPGALARLRHQTAFAWLDGHTIHPRFQVFVLLTMLRSLDSAWMADAVTGLVTADEFIPLFSIEESVLCRRLVDEGRALYKPLPYDGGAAQVPNFILTDTGASSVALEIITDDCAAAAVRRSRIEEYQKTQRRFWTWDACTSLMPPPLGDSK